MPDQPNGSGSCGVGVIYCVRDLSQGIQEKFTWTYKESPTLRAQLVTELLKGYFRIFFGILTVLPINKTRKGCDREGRIC